MSYLRLIILVSLTTMSVSIVDAQCSNTVSANDYNNKINYVENKEKGFLKDAEWDKAVLLGKEYFSTPYPSGIFENNVFNSWKLIDLSTEGLQHSIVAVNKSGEQGYIFYSTSAFTKNDEKEIVKDRIKKNHLKSFNSLLKEENINIDSPEEAMRVSLLFIQLSTYKFSNSFVEVIESTKDISDRSHNSENFQLTNQNLDKLSKILSPPCLNKINQMFQTSFFTVDSNLRIIEEWKLILNTSRIKHISRSEIFELK